MPMNDYNVEIMIEKKINELIKKNNNYVKRIKQLEDELNNKHVKQENKWRSKEFNKLYPQ